MTQPDEIADFREFVAYSHTILHFMAEVRISFVVATGEVQQSMLIVWPI